MILLPVIILLTAAVALGLVLGVLYLRGVRKPVLIGIHLLLGAGGLEQLAILSRGTPSGIIVRAGTLGTTAALLFAVAMFVGFVSPLLRQWPRGAEVLLATHVTLGIAGFLVFLAWVSGA